MRIVPALAMVLLGAGLLACGGGSGVEPEAGARAAGGSAATGPMAEIVVTTSVLGDVVANVAGDAATVRVIMPPGADPHEFAPSARQAEAMRSADVLVVNGLGLEIGMLGAIEATARDGVPVYEAASALGPAELLGTDGRDDGDGHGHDDGHDDGDGHGHDDGSGVDPHFFTDPARMATVAEGLGAFLAEQLGGADPRALLASAKAYAEQLRALDAEVEELLAAIPPERRVLIANHGVLGYFADRYGFEVLGTIIPGGTTLAEPSAAELARLAAAVEEAGVAAIFADASARTRLAEALAAEVGYEVAVVELHSESLGPDGSGADTYVGMVRTNAERVAGGLGG